MTNIPGRSRTALLVIDMQEGVVADAHNRDGVIANINILVEKARTEGVPVVWVQHSDDEALVQGSDAWDYVPELRRRDEEALVPKRYGDAFEATDLADVLAAGGVGRVVVTGTQTDECIRATLHGAVVRGYDATLVSDAHTTEDLTAYGAPPPEQVVAHTNLYWGNHRAPGRTTGTVAAADLRW